MDETIRVMAIHSLSYCQRLCYLEEVEGITLADNRVFEGRSVHEKIGGEEKIKTITLESNSLKLRGKVDALKTLSGQLVPYEHKKGHAKASETGPQPWHGDLLQLTAYAMLLEEHLGQTIRQGKIRYHAQNLTLTCDITDDLKAEVRQAVERIQTLFSQTLRPPVTEDEKKCITCSLAPVCLPEETRALAQTSHPPRQLFPPIDERLSLHVLGHKTQVKKSANQIVLHTEESKEKFPIETIRSITLHGYVQCSAQLLSFCGQRGIPVHWMGKGGWYQGSFYRDDHSVKRRIRQFQSLSDELFCLRLSQTLVLAKIDSQLRFLMRATRGTKRAKEVTTSITTLKDCIKRCPTATTKESLLGLEGSAARAYFRAMPFMIDVEELRPSGRSKRPPEDPFNALISFGYALLLRETTAAIRSSGLEAGFGFYHSPRTTAPPLALDLMEVFRVPVVDMAIAAAINRLSFRAEDFQRAGRQVWCSQSGKKKAIEVIERRLNDTWKHPIMGYSLSYKRHIELEVGLLEKEWSGEPGGFAQTRMR